MSLSLLFWLLIVLALVFGLWSNWPVGGNVRPLGSWMFLLVLIIILGWQVFGAAIKK